MAVFGEKGEERLAKALRKALGSKKKTRKSRFADIEVDCLDVCPKKGVTTLRAGAPTDWVVIPEGTPVPQVLATLGLSASFDRKD